MSELRLARNVKANILQTIAGIVLLFVLYRFLNASLGIESLGVWSVVLATVSASRLADLGLSSSVTRFVARDLARGNMQRAAQVIDTASFALMVAAGVLAPLLYVPLKMLLAKIFDAHALASALQILPAALFSLWLSIVGATFQGGLDGCQRMGMRAAIVTVSQALMLIMAVLLVPAHGLMGLAWAQIAQAGFLFFAGRVALLRVLPTLRFVPRDWQSSVFREMLGYGAKLQVASIFLLLLDPFAKAMMARFGGAVSAGYFEIASQVVSKLRGVIIAANQSIVPLIATMKEVEPANIEKLYRDNLSLLLFIGLPAFSLLFAWGELVSYLLIGKSVSSFVQLLGWLSVAAFVNVLSGPTFFVNAGIGRVEWNAIAQVAMGGVNAGLGVILGIRYGADGVVAAYVTAMCVGSGLLMLASHRRIAAFSFVSLSSGQGALATAAAATITIGVVFPLRLDDLTTLPILLLLPPLMFSAVAARHPLGRAILHRLLRARRKTSGVEKSL